MILAMILVGCGPTESDDSGTDTQPQEVVCDTSISGNICPYAGTGDAGFNGEGGDKLDAWFYFPMDLCVSSVGNPVINDWNNHKMRMVEDDGTIVTIMGTDFIGDGPTDASDKVYPGAPGTTVNLNHPTDCEWDADEGILYSASWHTHKIRTWDPATGLVYVWAGNGSGFAGDGTDKANALFNQTRGYAKAPDGNRYIVDMRNERIRVIDTDNIINTVIGDGTQNYTGDGDVATAATVNFPTGDNPMPGGSVAFDGTTMYLADTLNQVIRRVDLVTGIVDTVLGTGVAGYAGDGGPALSAQINTVADIEFHDGLLYIADSYNHAIRTWDPVADVVETIVGTGQAGDAGDGGPAADAQLNTPFGIDLAEDGTLYIVDTFNHRLRVVAP